MCDNISREGSTGADNAMKFFFLLKVNGPSKVWGLLSSMERNIVVEVAVFSSEPFAIIRKGEEHSLPLQSLGLIYLKIPDSL